MIKIFGREIFVISNIQESGNLRRGIVVQRIIPAAAAKVE